jgi:hypothetical protein
MKTFTGTLSLVRRNSPPERRRLSLMRLTASRIESRTGLMLEKTASLPRALIWRFA